MGSVHFQASQKIAQQPTVYTKEKDRLVSFGICVSSSVTTEGSLSISHTEGYIIYFLDPTNQQWYF